ncbi:hypothetical protein TVAG_169870 [Trichomonas vaginalis G3]|uniref:LisH domain-containing protein n=1 Tax=Trichomonas vaginalis (strain ATCC PRA-98 / G3) TaxID=412133 RepID=A2DPD1_TRIV3|nr:hypothetical protein TVAGG3_0681080 [Trichomonas vaginalis G3]EAY17675.1 hypothetical protein TVAG_169870 [Trichomonas vaginalis G3]KAI5507921.1 hypothetical protein TVAGG3_0681080 [Trichomonas vaginalis G3]|eukprot:XP_001329810.1 hypothetical protein [Trichomonas vaginalis G3]
MSQQDAQKRVLITKEAKIDLDRKVDRDIKNAGGNNVIQAKYIREIGKQINNATDAKIDRLKSAPFVHDEEAWQKAFNLVVAYLRRYKMDITLSAIKDEGITVPKETGYQRASDVNGQFRRFDLISANLGALTFRDRVEALAKGVQETPKK